MMRRNADEHGGHGRGVQALETGESETVAVSLEPGEYELLCGVVEEVRGERVNHSEEGMSTTLVVTEDDAA